MAADYIVGYVPCEGEEELDELFETNVPRVIPVRAGRSAMHLAPDVATGADFPAGRGSRGACSISASKKRPRRVGTLPWVQDLSARGATT